MCVTSFFITCNCKQTLLSWINKMNSNVFQANDLYYTCIILLYNQIDWTFVILKTISGRWYPGQYIVFLSFYFEPVGQIDSILDFK